MPTALEVADSFEPALRDDFLAIVDVVANSVPEVELQAWLEARDIASILRAFEEAVGRVLGSTAVSNLTRTYASLVQGGVSLVAGTDLAFDLISQAVARRLRHNSSRLVVAISQNALDSLQQILGQSYLDGIGTAASSRLIRSVVGLLPSHANAVGRYAASLQDQGIPEPRLSHFTDTYARRLLKYRAENIARTESAAAVHAAQVQAWIEQAKSGVLQHHRTRMVWDVFEDDRLCPWCAPMDGVEVGLGEMFVSTHKGFPEGKPENREPGSRRRRQSPIRPDPRSQPRDAQGRYTRLTKRDERDHLDGKLVPLKHSIVVAHPPLHPQCRCGVHLRFID